MTTWHTGLCPEVAWLGSSRAPLGQQENSTGAQETMHQASAWGCQAWASLYLLFCTYPTPAPYGLLGAWATWEKKDLSQTLKKFGFSQGDGRRKQFIFPWHRAEGWKMEVNHQVYETEGQIQKEAPEMGSAGCTEACKMGPGE